MSSTLIIDNNTNNSLAMVPPGKKIYMDMEQEAQNLVPGVCTGAKAFNIYFSIWLLWIIISLIIFVLQNEYNTIWWIFFILFIIGLLWGIFSISEIIINNIIFPPTSSPYCNPIINAYNGEKEKQAGHVDLKRLFIVCNPFAGKESGKLMAQKATTIFENKGINVKIVYSEFKGHIISLVKEADLNHYDGIVVIGGDGSLCELVNGMYARKDKSNIPIGCIPCGSGNSFMTDFGMKWTTAEPVINMIAEGHTAWLDSVRLTDSNKSIDMFSINLVATALLADGQIHCDRYRWLFGTLRYDIVGLWRLINSEVAPTAIHITNDEDKTITLNNRYLTVWAGNNQFMGNKWHTTPQSKLDDGCFTLGAVINGKKASKVSFFLQLKKGQHLDNKLVSFYKAKKVVLCSEEKKGCLNIDGETYIYDGDITMESYHKFFNFFVPESSLK